MSDKLPKLKGGSEPSESGSWGIGQWMMIAGGIIIGFIVLNAVISFVWGLMFWALKWGFVALAVYIAYLGVKSLFSSGSNSALSTPQASEEELEKERQEMEQRHVESASVDELAFMEFGDEDDEVMVKDPKEEKLEREFAELERQFSDNSK